MDYLTRFPHPAVKCQVSRTGASQPVWSSDGKKRFYLDECLNGRFRIVDSVVESTAPVVLVMNWDTELKKQVGSLPVHQVVRIFYQNDFIFLDHRHQDVFQFLFPEFAFVKLGFHGLAGS